MMPRLITLTNTAKRAKTGKAETDVDIYRDRAVWAGIAIIHYLRWRNLDETPAEAHVNDCWVKVYGMLAAHFGRLALERM